MIKVDIQTSQYYSQHAAKAFKEYEACDEGISKYFALAFPKASKILDIGAGSGRDIGRLLETGYDAYGVEPCDELRNLSLQNRPQLIGRIIDGALPSFDIPFGGGFDGILCSAVLMHPRF